jgi:hypothetical protein
VDKDVSVPHTPTVSTAAVSSTRPITLQILGLSPSDHLILLYVSTLDKELCLRKEESVRNQPFVGF